MIGSDGPKTVPYLTQGTPKIQPKRLPNVPYDRLWSLQSRPSPPKTIFGIRNDSKIGRQKGPRHTHNGQKTGIISDFPHDYDEDLFRTFLA